MINFKTCLFFISSWSTGYRGTSLLYTDDVTVAYICGNCIRFLNTETNEEKFIESPGDGIGAFASNPAYNTLAFSDVCLDAMIYIYELSLRAQPKVTLRGIYEFAVKVAF